MRLPIEAIPNSRPQRFRWKQTVSTPDGPRAVEYEGTMPATVEVALKELITLANTLVEQRDRLLVLLEERDRLLEEAESVAHVAPAPPTTSSSRKPRG